MRFYFVVDVLPHACVCSARFTVCRYVTEHLIYIARREPPVTRQLSPSSNPSFLRLVTADV